jgi:hypothetical protein
MGQGFNTLKGGLPLALTYLALAACESGPWPASYLTEAVGQQTQAEVRQRLGPPDAAARSLDGGSLWTYQFVRGMPTTAFHECWDVALSFDKQGVLRHWTQDPCPEEVPELSRNRDDVEPAK